jgi:hypothetical protein
LQERDQHKKRDGERKERVERKARLLREKVESRWREPFRESRSGAGESR